MQHPHVSAYMVHETLFGWIFALSFDGPQGGTVYWYTTDTCIKEQAILLAKHAGNPFVGVKQ